MAVPAHDERDFEFAKKFNLEIKKVIEPIFEDSKGESAVRKGLQFVERNAVSCIVKHWEKDEFIILRWKEIDWTTFVTGGIEANETPEIAGLREIREETGYQNAQFIRHLGKVHSKFYHNPKKENRFAHFHVLYYELTDDKSLPLSDVENKKHKVEWVSRDEVKNVLGPNGDWFSWKLFKDPHTVYTGEGIAVDSGEYSSLSSQEARLHMTADFGRPIVQYKLRDWVFSRQRYWGEPIPLVHCEKCGTVPVPENQLPLTLPEVEKYEPTGTGESPLAAIDSWVNTTCPKCIGPAKRETNTMPQWAGSSWYFLRYADPTNERELASKDKLSYWQPVDVYFGGMEHTTLHLLYSRFWNLFLFDIGVVTSKEPYLRRIPHGIILGPDGEKMSKSRGNVVNPDDVVAQYGADTLRMYEMFLGPHEQVIAWNDKGIIGVKRFLDRVCDFVPDPNAPAVPEIHRLIKKVTEDLAAFKFNTSVAAFMEFLKNHKMNKDDFEVYLKLLAPFAPHATDELWHKFGHERSIHQEAWPSFDPGKIALTEVVVAVQVLGKTRGTILIKAGSSQQEVEDAAKQLSAVAKQLEGWEIIKVVFVADRLINFVVK
jgi:leucyl-tRNA synthetase family protein